MYAILVLQNGKEVYQPAMRRLLNLSRSLLAAGILCFGVATFAGAQSTETAHYEASWGGQVIGSLDLELSKGITETVYRVRAMSSAAISPILSISGTAVSSLIRRENPTESAVPSHFEIHLDDRGTRSHRSVSFDSLNLSARVVDEGSPGGVSFHLAGPTYDPISFLHRIRELRLDPGEVQIVEVVGSRRLQSVAVKALRREAVEIAGRRWDTRVVETTVGFDGLGILGAPGRVTFWLSDDARRWPVRIRKELPGKRAEDLAVLLSKPPGLMAPSGLASYRYITFELTHEGRRLAEPARVGE